MFLRFGLIALLLAHVSGLEVIWNDAADFDEATIQGVNDGSITRVELPSDKVIFPGTLWCGAGNISKSEEDLGFFKETDKCCRAHDMCDDTVRGGDYNTRYNCKCETTFHSCLKAVETIPSKRVGFIYFNILGMQCYELDYPVTGCKEQVYIPRPRCLEYEFDTSKKKRYQWFDVPFF